jgi:hypothetical protein
MSFAIFLVSKQPPVHSTTSLLALMVLVGEKAGKNFTDILTKNKEGKRWGCVG